MLSLNAIDGPQMPNGLRLSVPTGGFPFAALRPGMSVLLGAQQHHIEAIQCSIDLSTCPQWDPHIYRPATLDRPVLESNAERLAAIWNNVSVTHYIHHADKHDIRLMAPVALWAWGGVDADGG